MIRHTLLVLWLAALIAGPAAAESVNERSERTDDPRGVTGISVENRRGRVDVRVSADGRIHLTALKTARAQTLERARAYATQTRVIAGPSGGEYVVRVEYPRKVEVKFNFSI